MYWPRGRYHISYLFPNEIPIAHMGRPWTGTGSESNPDGKGRRARPGERGDGRAQRWSTRECWPAGLPDALKGEGSRSSSDAPSMAEERLDPFKGPLPACRVRRVRRFHHPVFPVPAGIGLSSPEVTRNAGGGEGEASTATSKGSGQPRGFERGAAPPLVRAPCVVHGVAWLRHCKVL